MCCKIVSGESRCRHVSTWLEKLVDETPKCPRVVLHVIDSRQPELGEFALIELSLMVERGTGLSRLRKSQGVNPFMHLEETFP